VGILPYRWQDAQMSTIPVVWSSRTRLHVAGAEVWVGVRIPGTEVPERVDLIRDTLVEAGHPLVEAGAHDDEVLVAVHDAALVEHLQTVYPTWVEAGFLDDPGQDRVVPYVFPTAEMLGPLPRHDAAAVHARAGVYAYDTMTVLGPGTYDAARAAVDCALTAVDLVEAGESAAYALCRPPGHHVTRSAYGGSCYLNNAAVAAQALRSADHERVAIVDLDAHHGNGTAAIFYERGDVFYGSVHVDPAAGWFPHFVGYADERGVGDGQGCTLNVPLAPGSADPAWLAAVADLARAVDSFGASALVVSLGVDASADDPESPLLVTADGYVRAGRLLGELNLPSVIVQEGGYHLESLGGLVAAYLGGHSAL
jgi:acetoin utilization deacetylase AcuC-like enzyme